MPSSTTNSALWRGARHALPFALIVGPFSLLFGVVATEAGLGIAETMGFSVFVIAGASQFAALQQMVDGAPLLIVILTSLAVNMRMAMYSAALTPYLGQAPLWQRALVAYLNVDQTYTLGVAEYERNPDMTLPERMAYFFGVAMLIAPVWYAGTLIGALLGARIPPEFALDFALPLSFIALIAPMLRTPAHMVAAAVSVLGALAFASLPLNAGLLVAAGLAMVAGALTEVWLERRAA